MLTALYTEHVEQMRAMHGGDADDHAAGEGDVNDLISLARMTQ
jgi:hypothetical protein